MFAVNCVLVFIVHEFTVIPAPKLHVGPDRKLLPARLIDTLLFPCIQLFGVAVLSVGGGFTATACTVNPLFSVAVWLSVLVTVTVRLPTVAFPAIVLFAVNCVLVFIVHEFTVIPAPKLHPGEA